MDDIDRFLSEDVGKEGDITSDALLTDESASAVIRAKDDCVLAGLAEAEQVFERTGARAQPLIKDGTMVKKGTVVLNINGPARAILKGERLALNFIGRMSGIATETNTLMQRCRRRNPKVTIAATRKTTPGFRVYEKKAVLLGGGESHRYGLFDAFLIKDNHLKMIGSVETAIRKVREKARSKSIEIEVENESDALIAARMKVDVLMLDNFDAKTGGIVAEKVREINPHVLIEVSGGITAENIDTYAVFADRISLGCLTHSVKSKDFSLEIFKN
jgi:nicotinate-nucleotide pyrophosphorylase (carboxylating)